jgi:hypothetical protein
MACRRCIRRDFIGQGVGWYQLDQGAGLIGVTVGAVIVSLE